MKYYVRLIPVCVCAVTAAWLLAYWLQPETGPPLKEVRRVTLPAPVPPVARVKVTTPPLARLASPAPIVPVATVEDTATSPEDARAILSRGWIDFIEQRLQPLIAAGEYDETDFGDAAQQQRVHYSHACYTLAHGEEQHDAWQAFIDWADRKGSFDRMIELCTID